MMSLRITTLNVSKNLPWSKAGYLFESVTILVLQVFDSVCLFCPTQHAFFNSLESILTETFHTPSKAVQELWFPGWYRATKGTASNARGLVASIGSYWNAILAGRTWRVHDKNFHKTRSSWPVLSIHSSSARYVDIVGHYSIACCSLLMSSYHYSSTTRIL